MSEIRTTPLTADEIACYADEGYVVPGRILDGDTLERLRQALDRIRRGEAEQGREYDLLDAMIEDNPIPKPPEGQSVGFLFNLWLLDSSFRAVALHPTLGRWAAQLIGAPRVRLLEDGAIYKEPEKGGRLAWHQDYPYWPLAQPNVVTAWIALDHVTVENGCMVVAPRTHLLGERLPVEFSTGRSFLAEKRPKDMQAIGDPDQLGMEVKRVELLPGEVSFHHGLTWHASGANVSPRPRRGFVPRYVADGTIWMGARRFNYNYTDEEVGLTPGDPIGGEYFPLVPA